MKLIRAFFSWYFGKDSLPYWCVLGLDCVSLVFFYYVGYFCVLGSLGVVDDFWIKLAMIGFCLIPYLICYRIFHTYTNIIRYSSFIDLRNVVFANLLASCVVLILRVSFFEYDDMIFPGLRVVLFAFSFATLFMCGWRVLAKSVCDIANVNAEARNIFIYGTREGGVSLAKSIRNQTNSDFLVRGFISPLCDMDRQYMAGLPVYADDIKLIGVLLREHITGVMVSPLQTEAFRDNERLVSELTEAGIQIYMMPEAQKWDGKTSLTQNMLREVDIEDLLPREKIEVNMTAIGHQLGGHRILISGAAGSIGSEIVRQVASFSPSELLLIDQAETPMHDMRRMMQRLYPDITCHTVVASITHAERMERLFAAHRPEFVFHAAAYKHVPMMEDNPSEAVINNILGTRIMADLAVKYGTRKFVMISTDKAVNPTNVMGCSKRICEMYCQSLSHKQPADGTQFVTTRFGNVLGSNGSVIPIFREQIRRGGPVTVTHKDIIRYFMLIPEACKLVLEAGSFGKGGEIFVFDMGKAVKIDDLAKRMIALSNAKNVKIEYTGLRDGEKLFEEMLSSAEVTKPTSHNKIRIAQVRECEYDVVSEQIGRLCNACLSAADDMEIVRIMKEIVPEFKSQHSKYEVLD
ncbi:MAG: polysaccharide biosynthesis protein [Bacteroidales bacterium]|nr:polysaccharide biosynthesis protein [Candidatus Liminaster caballi]